MHGFVSGTLKRNLHIERCSAIVLIQKQMVLLFCTWKHKTPHLPTAEIWTLSGPLLPCTQKIFPSRQSHGNMFCCLAMFYRWETEAEKDLSPNSSCIMLCTTIFSDFWKASKPENNFNAHFAQNVLKICCDLKQNLLPAF